MTKTELPGAAPSFGTPESGAEPKVVLAAVAGAHGISGEVRLKLFGESAESLGRHGSVVERALARSAQVRRFCPLGS